MSAIPIITLDGPGGSGKGTIGLRVAKTLGWHFLDSGALYRVLALSMLNKQIPIEDQKGILVAAQTLDVVFNDVILLEGKPVQDLIRSERCGNLASQIAMITSVREALLSRQHDFCRLPGLVADGRDMGTVVFPEANIKFFLEASLEERAKRRYEQLKNSEQDANLESLVKTLKERDTRDQQRVIAPLKPAQDAVVIDTTGMGIDIVFAQVMTVVRKRFNLK